MVRPRKKDLLSPNTPTFPPSLHPHSAVPYRPTEPSPQHGAEIASSSAPTSGAVTPVAPANAANEQRSGKRKCVSTACIPCRKRKSKCDGGLPLCSTCTAVYKTECSYEADVDTRRKAVKREDSSDAAGTDAARQILAQLRVCPEGEIQELLSHIRNEDNDAAIIEDLRVRASRQKTSPNGIEGAFPRQHRSSFSVAGQTRLYGATSQLSLLPAEDTMHSENMRTHPDSTFSRTEGWTKVTTDLGFVRHLIRLYFTWQHPFYYVLDEDAFWHDFNNGETEYCSSLLVNAICAYGCHNSDLPQAKSDPQNSRSAGDHFFAEARRLLYEHENSRLTTAQALQIMSMREASADRDSSGYTYAGRSLRMAMEMGLHRNSHDAGLSDTVLRSRRLTFWGLFTCETAWSVAIGRTAGISDSAVDTHKLPVDKIEREWVSYTDDDYLGKASPSPPRRFNFSEFHRALWSFSELVNSAVSMFYAPRTRLKAYTIIDKQKLYEKWFKALPECLQITEHSPPQIYDLHIYYNICSFHLFNTFSNFTLITNFTEINTHEVCAKHIQEIVKIMRAYRMHFPLRRCNLLLTHVLLNVSVFLATSLPPQNSTESSRENEEASRDIVEIMRDLSIMTPCMEFAARCFTISFKRAHEWDKQIPAAAYELMQLSPSLSTDTRLMRNVQAAPLPSPAQPYHPIPVQHHQQYDPEILNHSRQFASTNNSQTLASGNHTSHQSNANFNPHLNGTSLPTRPLSRLNGSEAMQSSSVAPHTPLDQNNSNYSQMYAPTSHAATPQTGNAPMFYAPIPGQGIPLLNYTSSPMDVYNVMDGDILERMKTDGFILNEAPYGPVSVSNLAQHYQQQQPQQPTNGHGHNRASHTATYNPHPHQQNHPHHSNYPMPDHQAQVVSPTHDSFSYNPGMQGGSSAGETKPLGNNPPWWMSGARAGHQQSRPL